MEKSGLKHDLVLNKLIKILAAGGDLQPKNAFFVCLTELLRRTQPSFSSIKTHLDDILKVITNQYQ